MTVEKDGEYISRSDNVRNEEVLRRVEEERNILHAIQRRMATWIGHSLCRNCLLIHFIERYKGQEDEEEEVSNYWMTLRGKNRHWNLEEETLAALSGELDLDGTVGL